MPLGSCTLYLQQAFVSVSRTSDPVGFATMPISAPRDPAATGLTFFGLALTGGLQLTIGD